MLRLCLLVTILLSQLNAPQQLRIGTHMAAGNGFLSESPDERYGTSESTMAASQAFMQLYVMPGEGVFELTEIGAYLRTAAGIGDVHLAVFTHDAVNGCPDVMVENSDSGEIAVTQTAYDKSYALYAGTKPQVTGGQSYWIGQIDSADEAVYTSRISTGGTGRGLTGQTYPTWPTGDAWHSASPSARDHSYYAVYAAAAGGPVNVKTLHGLEKASVKTINDTAIASVKTLHGLN